jgi:hypothetical protein
MESETQSRLESKVLGKTFKTSEQRRQYQREYYKLRQQRIIQSETQSIGQEQEKKKSEQSGGDLIKKKISETQSRLENSGTQSRLENFVFGKVLGKNNVDSDSSLDSNEDDRILNKSNKLHEHVNKIDKDKIVSFKLKKAISYIEKNINADGENYIMDLADSLKYNLESVDGAYEFIKVLEKYLGRTF